MRQKGRVSVSEHSTHCMYFELVLKKIHVCISTTQTHRSATLSTACKLIALYLSVGCISSMPLVAMFLLSPPMSMSSSSFLRLVSIDSIDADGSESTFTFAEIRRGLVRISCKY